MRTWLFVVIMAAWASLMPRMAAADSLDGPVVLHANVDFLWGGHTFAYALQTPDSLVWTARMYSAEESRLPLTCLVGQYPLSTGSPPRVYEFMLSDPALFRCNTPQVLRSPDGYLHLFLGVYKSLTPVPQSGALDPAQTIGDILYYRSARPDDVSAWEDKTALLPKGTYADFHLRQNAGISRDGQRIALVTLAISRDGSVPFNTPLLFVGEKEGADYVFKTPVVYAEPMSLFYPQVATLEEGILVVGQVWDTKDRVTGRLLHLDWNGMVVHREDLSLDQDGMRVPYDLRPASRDWTRLNMYVGNSPKSQQGCAHEFWQYDMRTRQLRLLRSISVDYPLSNPGKWVNVRKGKDMFINNPSMGNLNYWRDILGNLEPRPETVPLAEPMDLGFKCTQYVMTPNVLQGSVRSRGSFYVLSDCMWPGTSPEQKMPNALLLWRCR